MPNKPVAERYRFTASIFALSLSEEEFDKWLKYIKEFRNSLVGDAVKDIIRLMEGGL